MFCADSMGRCRMRGRRSTFIKRVCEFRGRRSVSLIRKRGETKVNPLRRLCVSSLSGAVRICLALGEPYAEILHVEACECVLLSANPLRRSCVSKSSRVAPFDCSVFFACESVLGSCLVVRASAFTIAR